MRLKLRPCLARLRQHEIEHPLCLPFRVRDQCETIGQQGLHHQSHLVFRGIPLRPRLNVKPIGVDPTWQTKQVTLTKLVCESEIHDQRLVVAEKKAPGTYASPGPNGKREFAAALDMFRLTDPTSNAGLLA